MDVNDLQKLYIKNDSAGVKVSIDEKELQNIKEYKIESSAAGMTELTLKLMVKFP